ncbi:unnamed protein product, partial [Didymodactylos carnosus]
KFVQLMLHIHQFNDALQILFERWTDLVDEDTITSRQTLSVVQSFVNPVERLSKGSNIDQNLLESIENRLNDSPSTDTIRLDDALINYQIALKKALESEPTTNPLLGNCYYRIGFTYLKLEDFERALQYHKNALAIYSRSLPPTHLSFHKVYLAYGVCLMNLNRYEEAMEYFQKAIEVHRAYPGHECVVEAEQQFAEIYCNPQKNGIDRKKMDDLIAKLDKLGEE